MNDNKLQTARSILKRFKAYDQSLKQDEIDGFVKYINENAKLNEVAHVFLVKYEVLVERNILMAQCPNQDLQFYVFRKFSLGILDNPSAGYPHLDATQFWVPAVDKKNIGNLRNNLVRLIMDYSVPFFLEEGSDDFYFDVYYTILKRAYYLELVDSHFFEQYNLFYDHIVKFRNENKDNLICQEICMHVNRLIPVIFLAKQTDSQAIQNFILSCNKDFSLLMPILYSMALLLKMTDPNFLKSLFLQLSEALLTKEFKDLKDTLFSLPVSSGKRSREESQEKENEEPNTKKQKIGEKIEVKEEAKIGDASQEKASLSYSSNI